MSKDIIHCVVQSSVGPEAVHCIPRHIINFRSEFQDLPRHNLLVCLAAEASPFIPVTAMIGRVVVGGTFAYAISGDGLMVE